MAERVAHGSPPPAGARMEPRAERLRDWAVLAAELR